jgi:hypothetical protein
MRTALAGTRWIWLAPALGLLACNKSNENQAAMSGAAMAAMPAPANVALAAKNNSGITGSAVLTRSGDSTSVALTLNGATSGTAYPSHIHFGTCDQPGGVVAPLTSVTAGANGSGSSTTMVATAALDAARQAHGALLVQSHQPNGTPAACGAIPAP